MPDENVLEATEKVVAAPDAPETYDASKLGKLEGLEAVRKKPGMYIGGTDERALHHCVTEVLDNSVDEYLAGHCTRIDVTVHVDGSISIRDNGRGIPVDMHPEYKIPGVELVLTTLHSGGKYGQGGYTYSGGTHGVGAKCVNAVSEWFSVEVSRDGQVHQMEFERGKTTKKLEVIGKAKGTGTLVTFKPDPEIFTDTTEFKADLITQRLRELAFLNSSLEMTFLDERRRTAIRRQTRVVLLQGRHPGIRQAAWQRQAGLAPQDDCAEREAAIRVHAKRRQPQGGHHGGCRHSIQRQLQRAGACLHQHCPQPGRRHTPGWV